jgi:hypothetical protein
VAGEQRAEPHVVVDVLVAVDVAHARPRGVAHDDRVRLEELDARRHAEREHLAGAVDRDVRTLGAFGVGRQLARGDLLGPRDERGEITR